MSSASVINPLPTKDPRQDEQTKQSLCQCRPSNDMNRVPPIPKIPYMQPKTVQKQRRNSRMTIIKIVDKQCRSADSARLIEVAELLRAEKFLKDYCRKIVSIAESRPYLCSISSS